MAFCRLCKRLIQQSWLVSLPVAAAAVDMGACPLQSLCVAQADVSGVLTSLLQVVPKVFSSSAAPQQLGLQQVRLCDICQAHVLFSPLIWRLPFTAGFETQGQLWILHLADLHGA